MGGLVWPAEGAPIGKQKDVIVQKRSKMSMVLPLAFVAVAPHL
jgi:hypothetical protein